MQLNLSSTCSRLSWSRCLITQISQAFCRPFKAPHLQSRCSWFSTILLKLFLSFGKLQWTVEWESLRFKGMRKSLKKRKGEDLAANMVFLVSSQLLYGLSSCLVFLPYQMVALAINVMLWNPVSAFHVSIHYVMIATKIHKNAYLALKTWIKQLTSYLNWASVVHAILAAINVNTMDRVDPNVFSALMLIIYLKINFVNNAWIQVVHNVLIGT